MSGTSDYLCLNHGWTLRPQDPDCLKEINYTFALHTFQYDAQRHKHTRPTHAATATKKKRQLNRFSIGGSDAIIPAVDGDRTFLAELLFSFVYLSDEVYEPFSRLGHALFRPVRELELPDGPRPVVDRVGHLELSKYVLRHVVLRDGFDDERVVSNWSFGRPILVAFFLWKKLTYKSHAIAI